MGKLLVIGAQKKSWIGRSILISNSKAKWRLKKKPWSKPACRIGWWARTSLFDMSSLRKDIFPAPPNLTNKPPSLGLNHSTDHLSLTLLTTALFWQQSAHSLLAWGTPLNAKRGKNTVKMSRQKGFICLADSIQKRTMAGVQGSWRLLGHFHVHARSIPALLPRSWALGSCQHQPQFPLK